MISVDEHSDENEGEVSGEKPTEVTTSTGRNGSMSHLLPFLSRPFVTTQEACSLCFEIRRYDCSEWKRERRERIFRQVRQK